MSAFLPIPPMKAIDLVEASGVPDARRLIADFCAAGLVRSYALSIETTPVEGAATTVRDSAVSADLWKRIIRDRLVDDVWTGGTVYLPPADLVGGEPEVRITGIRFNAKYLQRLVDHHRRDIETYSSVEVAAVAPAAAPIKEPAAERASQRRTVDVAAIPPGALAVSVQQAQKALGLGRTKINELMNDGTLSKTKIGRAVRIDVASIHALVRTD